MGVLTSVIQANVKILWKNGDTLDHENGHAGTLNKPNVKIIKGFILQLTSAYWRHWLSA